LNPTDASRYLTDLRREKVASLLCANPSASTTSIARAINIPVSTCHDDITFLRQRASSYIKNFDVEFSHQYYLCIEMLSKLQGEAWHAVKVSKYERNKGQLMNCLREIVMSRADLLTSVSLIGKTVDFLQDLRKKKDHVLGLVDDALATEDAITVTDGVTEQVLEQSVEDGDEQDAESTDDIIVEEQHQSNVPGEGEE
jgi:hypothetical protein